MSVWDASTLFLLLQREPGWQELAARLPDSSMSSVNLSEVAAKLLEAGGDAAATRAILEALPLRIHDFTAELAYRAAGLREATRHLGLSFGDRACLALGLGLEASILTADRAWLGLDLGVEIALAR